MIHSLSEYEYIKNNCMVGRVDNVVPGAHHYQPLAVPIASPNVGKTSI
jgi:hypothetical protein